MAFKRFNPADDIVENQKTTISSGLWSGGSATLTSFFTQSANGNITGSFLELYNGTQIYQVQQNLNSQLDMHTLTEVVQQVIQLN